MHYIWVGNMIHACIHNVVPANVVTLFPGVAFPELST